jgi:hypothetical protein
LVRANFQYRSSGNRQNNHYLNSEEKWKYIGHILHKNKPTSPVIPWPEITKENGNGREEDLEKDSSDRAKRSHMAWGEAKRQPMRDKGGRRGMVKMILLKCFIVKVTK